MRLVDEPAAVLREGAPAVVQPLQAGLVDGDQGGGQPLLGQHLAVPDHQRRECDAARGEQGQGGQGRAAEDEHEEAGRHGEEHGQADIAEGGGRLAGGGQIGGEGFQSLMILPKGFRDHPRKIT